MECEGVDVEQFYSASPPDIIFARERVSQTLQEIRKEIESARGQTMHPLRSYEGGVLIGLSKALQVIDKHLNDVVPEKSGKI